LCVDQTICSIEPVALVPTVISPAFAQPASAPIHEGRSSLGPASRTARLERVEQARAGYEAFATQISIRSHRPGGSGGRPAPELIELQRSTGSASAPGTGVLLPSFALAGGILMLDRESARALAEAGYMPLEEYLRTFGNEPSAEDLRKASEDFSSEAYSVRLTRPWPGAGAQLVGKPQTSFSRKPTGRGSTSRKAS
jgi:hypothetical protein